MPSIDVSPIEFTCLDDRYLFARVGPEFEGHEVTSELPEHVNFILNELITVLDCKGPFTEVDAAIVTIIDGNGNQVGNYKFSCRRLDLSINFFNKGYSIKMECGHLTQVMPLSWDAFGDLIIPPSTVFH